MLKCPWKTELIYIASLAFWRYLNFLANKLTYKFSNLEFRLSSISLKGDLASFSRFCMKSMTACEYKEFNAPNVLYHEVHVGHGWVDCGF